MKRRLLWLVLTTLVVIGLYNQRSWAAQIMPTERPTSAIPEISADASSAISTGGNEAYLPLIMRNSFDWENPFGVEILKTLTPGSILLDRASTLGTNWVRLNRISWRLLQPNNKDDPIPWSLLGDFEIELQAIRSAGFTPVVIIQDYPSWAVKVARTDGKKTSCGPLDQAHFQDFADFMVALVNRYSTPDFNVHHWELGNEPDVDPDLVPVNSVFGCWGDIDNPYYGGGHYGNMLRVATPAIQAADPQAKVWIGGLLLDKPQPDPGAGHPELFFQGILEACRVSPAVDCFDILPYHWYPHYLQPHIDPDTAPGSWSSLGGGTVGKVRFLRNIMQSYGVNKPVFLNELGVGCREGNTYCDPPDGKTFFEEQADYAVRAFTRALSENIMGYIWFTLEGPGWRNAGLLNADNSPRPVYTAYKHFIQRMSSSRYIAPVNDYGGEIEAYAFDHDQQRIHILWMKNYNSVPLMVSVPQSKFVAAYNRDGIPISTIFSGGYAQVPAGFSPVYIVRLP